jgi:hypothetical protein
VSKIDTGYEGTNIPEDFMIPPCGIEDVDRAVFNLFNKDLKLEVEVNEKTSKVPVVFAAGERFALTRRKQPIRDRNGALILPVIAIARKSIDISPSQGGYGTAISVRDQSSYTIKRRLSKEDRKYQNIINKLSLKNQKNISSRGNFSQNLVFPGNEALPGTVASRRNGSDISYQIESSGQLLDPRIGNNIFEIITVPYPEFFLAQYEVTFWTQYTLNMNQILEVMMSNFSGQGMEFQIESDTGYQFVAYVKGNLTTGDNFNDYSSNERLIRYSFSIDVPAYLLASNQPGLPSPFRSFISAPQIEFKISQISSPVVSTNKTPDTSGDIDRFTLSDTEILNEKGEKPLARGQDGTAVYDTTVEDPFDKNGRKKLLRIKTRNQRSGESTISAREVIDLDTLT